MTQSIQSDIVIFGAGLVGCITALAWSQKGYQVTLLEKSDLNFHPHERFNVRAIALSWSSRQILQGLHIWPEIKHLCQPIKDIQVSSKGHWGVNRLKATDLNLEAMGYVIESDLMHQVLLELINKNKDIQLFKQYNLESLSLDKGLSNCYNIQYENEILNIESHLTCISDGIHSDIRGQSGFDIKKQSYFQHAICTTLEFSRPLSTTAFERFTSNGPIAMLPLTENRFGMVWTNPSEQSEKLMSLTDDVFKQAILKTFGYRMGSIKHMGPKFHFPLTKIIATELSHQRSVVLGNAAHNLHPVAGQSLNLAIRDIAHLTSQFDRLDHIDATLSDYNIQRKVDHQRIITMGDSLVNLFSNQLPIVNHIRSAALGLMDILPIAKHEFAWLGMGYGAQASDLQTGHISNE